MRERDTQIGKYSVRTNVVNTVVVGSGAAGLNAADRLYAYGNRDIAVITENMNAGTSRNAGSDKQTYYKLTLAGSEPDSVHEMARTLFEGQCVDGDIALCEAAMSSQCFFRLVELGVPFPRNRYGEYVGYKTDHDPRARASSAGPYTSRLMTERLQESIERLGVPVFDHTQVIKIMVENGRVKGILCLDLSHQEDDRKRFMAFRCKNIIYATGGPAGMYADSVYPFGQRGASGIAFEAGVRGKNLTEWQYGLASIKPRWNVSGTYMQVLPQVFSTDKDGGDKREFLLGYFPSAKDMLDNLFYKGYQWPFDVRKMAGGSSIIDFIVYLEIMKNRRVFLNYLNNPEGKPINFEVLAPDVRAYLTKAGACFGTPIERLLHMNRPAVDFYAENGVDLTKEALEISLCAQHNNGGLGIDSWWQTNIEGFFAVGEVAASHGVYRPGGSALNSGQVGSTRAAMYIASRETGEVSQDFSDADKNSILAAMSLCETIMDGSEKGNVQELWDKAALRMSRVGGAVRDINQIKRGAAEVNRELQMFSRAVRVSDPRDLWKAYRLWDILICQKLYLEAMVDYVKNGGKSRGSALYCSVEETRPHEDTESLRESMVYEIDDGSRGNLVQESELQINEEANCKFTWRETRPIPARDDFFENVWRQYRENGNINTSEFVKER